MAVKTSNQHHIGQFQVSDRERQHPAPTCAHAHPAQSGQNKENISKTRRTSKDGCAIPRRFPQLFEPDLIKMKAECRMWPWKRHVSTDALDFRCLKRFGRRSSGPGDAPGAHQEQAVVNRVQQAATNSVFRRREPAPSSHLASLDDARAQKYVEAAKLGRTGLKVTQGKPRTGQRGSWR